MNFRMRRGHFGPEKQMAGRQLACPSDSSSSWPPTLRTHRWTPPSSPLSCSDILHFPWGVFLAARYMSYTQKHWSWPQLSKVAHFWENASKCYTYQHTWSSLPAASLRKSYIGFFWILKCVLGPKCLIFRKDGQIHPCLGSSSSYSPVSFLYRAQSHLSSGFGCW